MTFAEQDNKRQSRAAAVDAPPLQPDAAPSGLGALTVHWEPTGNWPALTEPWTRLAAASGTNVFLAPAFALAARLVDPAPGLGAFVIARDGEWLGFVPGRMSLRGTVFSLWTHAYAPLGAPLALRGGEGVVLAALFGYLADEGVAAIDWPLLDEGPLSDALAEVAALRRADVLDRHRRAALTGAPPQASKDLRRLGRRLAEQGELKTVSTATGYALENAITAFLHLEAKGWKGRKGTALGASSASRGFFEAAVGGLAASGHARIELMLLGGQPIAGGVVLTTGDRAWYWKTAYDETLAKFSPGALITQGLGEVLTQQGFRLVDSCAIPGHPMIDRVWPGRLEITSRFIAVRAGNPGWRYRAALAVKRAKAGARSAAKALIGRIRRGRAKSAG
jgi:CelD/BcsL family acetyltransferase involved in cellulose biosynthesis